MIAMARFVHSTMCVVVAAAVMLAGAGLADAVTSDNDAALS